MEGGDDTVHFYLQHLKGVRLEKDHLQADCPFCGNSGKDSRGRLIVYLKKSSFFYGYFRCLNGCIPGGFPIWFAKCAGLDPALAPGFDPDREPFLQNIEYPSSNLNREVEAHTRSIPDQIYALFSEAGIDRHLLSRMHIGFNGRYLVYPYYLDDGNCYAARCVFPGRPEDFFWHGNEKFFAEEFQIFNVRDIECCENGTLFLCVGEDSLLILKKLGFPGVAVPDLQSLNSLSPERFAHIRTLFLVTSNSREATSSTRSMASRTGYKVRPFRWPAGLPENYSLWQLALDKRDEIKAAVSVMIGSASSFSPFASPLREFERFQAQLSMEGGSSYRDLRSGFPILDEAMDGVHGINVIGGAPKAGKSTFMIQMATEMAIRKIPVLYYDFENGRQKIYNRTLCRLSRIPAEVIRAASFTEEQKHSYHMALQEFKELLNSFRVINDRQVTPEIMRRHIDFIRHETGSAYTVVVIDSLHKLPFKDFSERRTGIDAWLRQLESIRDELQVSFLVVSELSRGDGRSYKETPHLGVFKGSGDIEYSADNAMVLYPSWDPAAPAVTGARERINKLWLVASREHSPGLVAEYKVDYPFWGFVECPAVV